MPPFAESEFEAENRWAKYRSYDPFPEIEPALLNSADFIDYVAATGMVHPFIEDRDYIKPASYGVPICGRCIYWDEDGKRHDFILSDKPLDGYGDIGHQAEFELKRNSIAFVTLEPTFRLPDYIGMRFDLAIREVYRGLLLGTGPLVDPGFKGKLSFPLHNLTDGSYHFRAGEHVVWVEFTKISTWKKWREATSSDQKMLIARDGQFYSFPEPKRARRDIRDYLYHANGGNSVRSSIPIEIKTARQAAETAKNSAQWIGWAASVGLCALITALVFGGYQAFMTTANLISSGRAEMNSNIGLIRDQLGDINKSSDDAVARIKTLEDKIGNIERRLDSASPNTPPPRRTP